MTSVVKDNQNNNSETHKQHVFTNMNPGIKEINKTCQRKGTKFWDPSYENHWARFKTIWKEFMCGSIEEKENRIKQDLKLPVWIKIQMSPTFRQ